MKHWIVEYQAPNGEWVEMYWHGDHQYPSLWLAVNAARRSTSVNSPTRVLCDGIVLATYTAHEVTIMHVTEES